MAVSTQWRVGMSVMGLDYNTVIVIAKDMEIDLSPCMWNKLRTLESVTLKGISKSVKSNRKGAE